MEIILALISIAYYLLMVICWCRICWKAGKGRIGLWAIIPPAVYILILILAFSKWNNKMEE